MKKIAVVTNFNIYEKAVAALKVADKLFELGCEVLVASFNKDKLARQKQESRLLISVAVLAFVSLYYLFDIDAAVVQCARNGLALAFVHNVAVDVADCGEADQYA